MLIMGLQKEPRTACMCASTRKDNVPPLPLLPLLPSSLPLFLPSSFPLIFSRVHKSIMPACVHASSLRVCMCVYVCVHACVHAFVCVIMSLSCQLVHVPHLTLPGGLRKAPLPPLPFSWHACVTSSCRLAHCEGQMCVCTMPAFSTETLGPQGKRQLSNVTQCGVRVSLLRRLHTSLSAPTSPGRRHEA